MDDDNLNNSNNDDDNNSSEIKNNDNGSVQLEPKISPVKAAFLGLAGGFFFYQIVGGIVSALIFGLNPESADVNALRLMNVAGQILFILLPALVFTKFIYSNVTEVIRFRTAPLKEVGLFALGMICLIPLLQNYLIIQNYFIEEIARWSSFISYFKDSFDSVNEMIEKMFTNLLAAKGISDYLIVFIAISLTPAVCEEVMFRGFIQKSFELKYRPLIAILITSVFFGIYHFSPYALIPLISLGFFIGYSAYKSNSLLVPVLLHFMNNFLSIAFYYLFEAKDIAGDAAVIQKEVISASEMRSALFNFSYQLILFAAVFGYILYFYRKKKKENKENQLTPSID